MQSPRSALTNSIIHVLNRFDPMGLEPDGDDGAPWDEYEPEARDMATILHATGSITSAEVNEIWRRWFDEDVEDAEPIAAALREQQASSTSARP